MICPKCKTKVSKEDAICPTCKLKLIFKCPRCNSSTRLGSVNCKECGYTFVKFCPKCHSTNYATSLTCRKCNYEFDTETNSENISPQNSPNIDSLEAKTLQKQQKFVNEIKDNDKLFLFYIDFINLDKIFQKYNKRE